MATAKIIFKRMCSVMMAFVIFGFIDNFLMIVAGDQIDSFIKTLGVSNTMLAAGLGNTFSDMVGILSGRTVEKIVHTKIPPVEDGELSKNKIMLAETVGIFLGCILGLFPLLFI